MVQIDLGNALLEVVVDAVAVGTSGGEVGFDELVGGDELLSRRFLSQGDGWNGGGITKSTARSRLSMTRTRVKSARIDAKSIASEELVEGGGGGGEDGSEDGVVG